MIFLVKYIVVINTNTTTRFSFSKLKQKTIIVWCLFVKISKTIAQVYFYKRENSF